MSTCQYTLNSSKLWQSQGPEGVNAIEYSNVRGQSIKEHFLEVLYQKETKEIP